LESGGKSEVSRIILADDQDFIRFGIKGMLSTRSDVQVVGEATNGREAIEMCRLLEPDLVLMDVEMPEIDGLQATREIRQELPVTRVLILTSHEDPDILLDAVQAGAAGFVSKESAFTRIGAAVDSVLRGEAYLDPNLTMLLLKRMSGEGYERVIDAGPNPKTSFNKESIEPGIGEDVLVEEFVRIVGDVRIGDGSSVGRRTTLRADDGTPVVVGENADIDDRFSFHALRGTSLEIGDGFTVADDAVLHGPLKIGDGVEDRAIIFRAEIGENVQIGDDTLIFGPALDKNGDLPLRIPDGTVIPEAAVITSPDDLDNSSTQ